MRQSEATDDDGAEEFDDVDLEDAESFASVQHLPDDDQDDAGSPGRDGNGHEGGYVDHDQDDALDWEGLEAEPSTPVGYLWAVHDVGALTQELDQLDELAGRWLTGASADPFTFSEASTDDDALDDDALDEDAEDEALEEDEPQDLPITLKYKLKYPDVFAWYEEWFRHHYRRRVDGRGRVWSGSWYDIPEAFARMESMWRAWESLRQDPETGGSRWFLHHADEHMKILMDTEGPFGHLQSSEQDHSSTTRPLAWRPPSKHDASGDAEAS